MAWDLHRTITVSGFAADPDVYATQTLPDTNVVEVKQVVNATAAKQELVIYCTALDASGAKVPGVTVAYELYALVPGPRGVSVSQQVSAGVISDALTVESAAPAGIYFMRLLVPSGGETVEVHTRSV